MKKQYVSNAVIRRLPRYYRQLEELLDEGVERISSSGLGKAMGLTASQIRQDLSCFGGFGQQGYGYSTKGLKDEIAQILGMDRNRPAILLGVGNLGRALVQNFSFKKSGFHLMAAFDTTPGTMETDFGVLHIYSREQIPAYLAETPVEVAVLTIPQAAVRETAHQLVSLGIRGIWNFTNVELKLNRPDVVVENVHFADSLLALSYLLSQ